MEQKEGVEAQEMTKKKAETCRPVLWRRFRLKIASELEEMSGPKEYADAKRENLGLRHQIGHVWRQRRQEFRPNASSARNAS